MSELSITKTSNVIEDFEVLIGYMRRINRPVMHNFSQNKALFINSHPRVPALYKEINRIMTWILQMSKRKIDISIITAYNRYVFDNAKFMKIQSPMCSIKVYNASLIYDSITQLSHINRKLEAILNSDSNEEYLFIMHSICNCFELTKEIPEEWIKFRVLFDSLMKDNKKKVYFIISERDVIDWFGGLDAFSDKSVLFIKVGNPGISSEYAIIREYDTKDDIIVYNSKDLFVRLDPFNGV